MALKKEGNRGNRERRARTLRIGGKATRILCPTKTKWVAHKLTKSTSIQFPPSELYAKPLNLTGEIIHFFSLLFSSSVSVGYGSGYVISSFPL